METTRPRGTDSAKIIAVIETRTMVGAGTTDNPYRHLIQYWDISGKLLSSHDTFIDELVDEQSAV